MQNQKRRRRRLQKNVSPTMERLADYCRDNLGLYLSVNGQRRGVTILKSLYECGVDSRENLTLGGLSRPTKVLNLLTKHGLVGVTGQDVFITDKGLELGDSLGFGS